MKHEINQLNTYLTFVEFILQLSENNDKYYYSERLKDVYTRDNYYENNNLIKETYGFYYNAPLWIMFYNTYYHINKKITLENLFIILPIYLKKIFMNNDNSLKLAIDIENSYIDEPKESKYWDLWVSSYEKVKNYEPEDPVFWKKGRSKELFR